MQGYAYLQTEGGERKEK